MAYLIVLNILTELCVFIIISCLINDIYLGTGLFGQQSTFGANPSLTAATTSAAAPTTSPFGGGGAAVSTQAAPFGAAPSSQAAPFGGAATSGASLFGNNAESSGLIFNLLFSI